VEGYEVQRGTIAPAGPGAREALRRGPSLASPCAESRQTHPAARCAAGAAGTGTCASMPCVRRPIPTPRWLNNRRSRTFRARG